MELRTVNSSNLKQVGYDKKGKVLRVIFTSGACYDYYSVDEQMFRHLIQSPSVGKFFHRYIKNSYKYSKI